MTYVIQCAACPTTFEAAHPSAKTCSAACRKALSRSNRAARDAASLARLGELIAHLSALATKDTRHD